MRICLPKFSNLKNKFAQNQSVKWDKESVLSIKSVFFATYSGKSGDYFVIMDVCLGHVLLVLLLVLLAGLLHHSPNVIGMLQACGWVKSLVSIGLGCRLGIAVCRFNHFVCVFIGRICY